MAKQDDFLLHKASWNQEILPGLLFRTDPTIRGIENWSLDILYQEQRITRVERRVGSVASFPLRDPDILTPKGIDQIKSSYC